ncbi:hypothetical protein T06_11964 [Trichinella sp. T6]|nr:hypothetical protein T06_11964 [Trichinella sp. T6]
MIVNFQHSPPRWTLVHHDDWAGSTKISDLTDLVIIPLEIFTLPTDSWEGSVLPPARYLQPSAAAEVASTFRALRELPSTLASNETRGVPPSSFGTSSGGAARSNYGCLLGLADHDGPGQEVCWGESQIVVCPVAYDRQRPIIDPGLDLAEHRPQLLRVCSTPSQDLGQCHFHRSHKPYPISSAPRCSFSYKPPLDVFVGESSLNHFPVVVAEERLQETSGLLKSPKIVGLDELWPTPPRDEPAQRTQEAVRGHIRD